MAQADSADPGCRAKYFIGFSGYSLPLVPVDEVSKSKATSQRSYYKASYDGESRLRTFEKFLDGVQFFRHEYDYFPTGVIREARVTNADGQTVIHKFDESGRRLEDD